MNDFKWRHFRGELILWAVRWYCSYGISYRELEEMLKERGFNVDHSTIHRWVLAYGPELEKRLRYYYTPHSLGCDSWRVDETYIKVKGKWRYLYRILDKQGRTIDFMLSQTRNGKAAKRALCKALRRLKAWQKPRVINTDKAGCYEWAIAELKKEGLLAKDVQHRQVKYLNNIIEGDHAKIKRVIKQTAGFKTMKTAYATIKGIEAMRAIKKGQTRAWHIQSGITGVVRLTEQIFNLGNSALTDAMEMLNRHFKNHSA